MIAFFCLCLVSLTIPFHVGAVGGMSEPHPMNEQVLEIANSVRDQIEATTGMLFQEFVPVSYTSQVCRLRSLWCSFVLIQ
jgi:hypothetical protein